MCIIICFYLMYNCEFAPCRGWGNGHLPACHLPQAVTARPADLPAADIRYVPFQTPWANGLQVGGWGERICSTALN